MSGQSVQALEFTLGGDSRSVWFGSKRIYVGGLISFASTVIFLFTLDISG